jgi:hypothetical protein
MRNYETRIKILLKSFIFDIFIVYNRNKSKYTFWFWSSNKEHREKFILNIINNYFLAETLSGLIK